MIVCRPVPCNRRQEVEAPSGAPPPAWAPTDLAGLSLWVSTRESDLWQNVAKSTAVAADGDPIRVATARFPAATDLTSASDAARPTFRTTAVGGGRGAQFDGVDDHLRTAAVAGVTGAQTVGIRFRRTTTGRLYSSVDATSLGHEIVITSATQISVKFGATGSSTTGGISTVPSLDVSTAYTLIATWDGVSTTAPSSYGLRLNGTSYAPASGGVLARPGTTAMTTIGARSSASPLFLFSGYIAEVVVVAGVLTGTDLTDLETYLDGWL